jgi:hypothetical protein
VKDDGKSTLKGKIQEGEEGKSKRGVQEGVAGWISLGKSD